MTPPTAVNAEESALMDKYASLVHARRAQVLHIVTMNLSTHPMTPPTAGYAEESALRGKYASLVHARRA